uniref:Uncharacterized protein n=1 Tax=Anguilla anguilla TaxID=7936 RepID=A0A0E9Q317_ANGAN
MFLILIVRVRLIQSFSQYTVPVLINWGWPNIIFCT